MTHGFFIGRLNPIHAGHEAVLDQMIRENGSKHCTIILGSSNAPASMRHFFSYSERRDFIRTLYPMLNIIGMPDYPTDDEWVDALVDISTAIIGTSSLKNTRFYGGTNDDLQLLTDANIPVELVDRFSGKTPIVSATEVRDLLLRNQPLDGVVNARIAPIVQELFITRWEEFKNR